MREILNRHIAAQWWRASIFPPTDSIVVELARREQVVSCSHKNGWARLEIEKTFFYKQHTTAISWRTPASSTPPHAVVATVPSAQKCGPARKKARRKLRSNSFPSRWPGPSKTLLPVLWTWGRKVVHSGRWQRGRENGNVVPILKYVLHLPACRRVDHSVDFLMIIDFEL